MHDLGALISYEEDNYIFLLWKGLFLCAPSFLYQTLQHISIITLPGDDFWNVPEILTLGWFDHTRVDSIATSTNCRTPCSFVYLTS